MKNLFLLALALSIFSCKESVDKHQQKIDSEKAAIDSINAARTKINDSIKILNDKNHFGDLSGSHKLSYSSDETTFSGTVNFTKRERDLYDISGNAKSGANTLDINGSIKRVSEKHLNFEGKVTQNISGSLYERTKKTTFFNEGKGNFWRLQHKVNKDGFVDYIDIHY